MLHTQRILSTVLSWRCSPITKHLLHTPVQFNMLPHISQIHVTALNTKPGQSWSGFQLSSVSLRKPQLFSLNSPFTFILTSKFCVSVAKRMLYEIPFHTTARDIDCGMHMNINFKTIKEILLCCDTIREEKPQNGELEIKLNFRFLQRWVWKGHLLGCWAV